MRKRIFLYICLLSLPLISCDKKIETDPSSTSYLTQEIEVDGFVYKKNSDSYYLSDYVGTNETITIKSSFIYDNKTYNITHIGNDSFNDNSTVKKITIEEGITTIGDFAFVNCSKLEELNLPNSLNSMGLSSVTNTHIKEIKLPDGPFQTTPSSFSGNPYLETVKFGHNANCFAIFAGCDSLKNVYIPKELNSYDVNSASYNFNYITSHETMNFVIEGEGPLNYSNNVLYYDNEPLFISKGAILKDTTTKINTEVLDKSCATYVVCSKNLEKIYGYMDKMRYFRYFIIDSTFEESKLEEYVKNNYKDYILYYSETKPSDTTYKYYHYVDGKIVGWGVDYQIK